MCGVIKKRKGNTTPPFTPTKHVLLHVPSYFNDTTKISQMEIFIDYFFVFSNLVMLTYPITQQAASAIS